jgi:hypothetical protein
MAIDKNSAEAHSFADFSPLRLPKSVAKSYFVLERAPKYMTEAEALATAESSQGFVCKCLGKFEPDKAVFKAPAAIESNNG